VFFCVVAYNAENFSALWSTARKMIGIVPYTAEKLSALLPTMVKNVLT
jgi:hypothetical protein